MRKTVRIFMILLSSYRWTKAWRSMEKTEVFIRGEFGGHF